MNEARADEAMITTCRHLLKDGELVIVLGKQQPDRFSGGMQLTITHIWDLEQARCRFGKFLRVAVTTGGADKAPDVARLLKDFPAQKEVTEEGDKVHGMPVRLAVNCQSPKGAASTELQLGEQARFYPSDAALAAWRLQAINGKSEIVYE